MAQLLDTINLHTESLDMLTQEYMVCRSKFSLQVCRSKSTVRSTAPHVTGDALDFSVKKKKVRTRNEVLKISVGKDGWVPRSIPIPSPHPCVFLY